MYPLFPAGKARHENITTEKAKAKVKDLTVGTIRSLACNPLREAVFPMRVSPEWHFQGGGVPVPLPGLPFPCVCAGDGPWTRIDVAAATGTGKNYSVHLSRGLMVEQGAKMAPEHKWDLITQVCALAWAAYACVGRRVQVNRRRSGLRGRPGCPGEDSMELY